MADQTLTTFVEAALRAGAPRDEVRQRLLDAGWSAEEVADGLNSYADTDFVVPVPRPRAQASARDAFRYLVIFGTLYVAAYQLGQLLFQFVNLAIPDELSANIDGVYYQIRWATSALIVAYPVFLFMSYRVATEIAHDPTRRNSSVRRWLTYITLFIAVSIIVGDVVALLFSFLSGEVSSRFLLKCLIVAVIAGSIFDYYFTAMHMDERALAQ